MDEEQKTIVNGIFDGENMVSDDDHIYKISSNYASKSKLVVGDLLKLTIKGSGEFVYKQVKLVPRDTLRGTLNVDEDGKYLIRTKSGDYRVLTASVTYYKMSLYDEAVIVIPVEKPEGSRQWGAIDNILRKDE